jgi:hypothetical protein
MGFIDTDFWHLVAVRSIGDSSGREWRKDRIIMHATLAAVNATFAGEMIPPDHWAMQAIAPLLKPHLLWRAAGDFRDVALTSDEEKLYARMLETRLREIVEELGILDSAQHGFRKGLSGDTAMWQLMSVIERQALVRRFGPTFACALSATALDLAAGSVSMPGESSATHVPALHRQSRTENDILVSVLSTGAHANDRPDDQSVSSGLSHCDSILSPGQGLRTRARRTTGK